MINYWELLTYWKNKKNKDNYHICSNYNNTELTLYDGDSVDLIQGTEYYLDVKKETPYEYSKRKSYYWDVDIILKNLSVEMRNRKIKYLLKING